MNQYTLTWKEIVARTRLDGSTLRPDTLCRLSLDELSKTPLRIGRESIALGDLFSIEQMPSQEDHLWLDHPPLIDRLGAGMREGMITVQGGVGDDLGASMRGGHIQVHGDAGDRVGGPDVGSDRGMTGGTIRVRGSAGDYAGLRMRRGMIVVYERAGKSPGYRMLAGTLVICRGPLDNPGLEMRRGTIVCFDPLSPPPPESAFSDEGLFEVRAAPFLALLQHNIVFTGMGAAPFDERGFRLFSGDRFELNKGEVWQWVS
jgi:formylmethanofuran dehydrogenase subunit C